MANIKYNTNPFNDFIYGEQHKGIIRIKGKIKWRKPLTITLTSPDNSVNFDGATSKNIDTYYGYTIHFQTETYRNPPSRVPRYRYRIAILDENEQVSEAIQVTFLDHKNYGAISFTNGEKITTDKTFEVISEGTEFSLAYKNSSQYISSITAYDLKEEEYISFVDQQITTYVNENIKIEINTGFKKLADESGYSIDYDDNDNRIYTRTFLIKGNVEIDLTLAND